METDTMQQAAWRIGEWSKAGAPKDDMGEPKSWKDCVAELDKLRAENTRLQMELDASCNAEELRQVRAESDAVKREMDDTRAHLAESVREMSKDRLADAAKHREERGQLQADLVGAKAELENYKHTVECTRATKDRAVSDLSTLQREAAGLREALTYIRDGGGHAIPQKAIFDYKETARAALSTTTFPALVSRKVLERCVEELELIVRVNSNTDSENKEDRLPDIHDIAERTIEFLTTELAKGEK